MALQCPNSGLTRKGLLFLKDHPQHHAREQRADRSGKGSGRLSNVSHTCGEPLGGSSPQLPSAESPGL